jgi:putative thiamine transport system permease protein
MRNQLLALPIIIIFVVPLLTAIALILPSLGNIEGFLAFIQHPQVRGAAQLTIGVGLISTLLSLAFAILIVISNHKRLMVETSAYLALPHVALAIGLGFLIAPTGLVARIFANVFSLTAPPQWETVQDPYGATLVAALILKEVPFLVWVLASLLIRDDLRLVFAGQARIARSLGHSEFSIWIAVLLPQLLPRIAWPLIAVFVYGLTVVDMALVVGPTQPPVLATLIWTDLSDSDALNNTRGAAGVIVLSCAILLLLSVAKLLVILAQKKLRFLLLSNHSGGQMFKTLGTVAWGMWRSIYALVAFFLIIASFSSLYPFPNIFPQTFTLKGWTTLFTSPRPILTSLTLAIAASATAIATVIAWFECQPRSRDRTIFVASGATLIIPSIVIALGQYRTFLSLGITGSATAMFAAHILPVTAYVFIMLHGPYRAFDNRWQTASAGLLTNRMMYLKRVKWPMLKAPIMSSAAVGFSVSMAQYLPAQLASAGRYTTLPMEAITLTASGNRALAATYALAMMLLPLCMFLAATKFSQSRWKTTHA